MSALKVILLSLFFTTLSSVAQVRDTLEFAREKAYDNEFSEANEILTSYNRKNNDVYGLWLQAQVTHWMGDLSQSRDLYRRAFILSPNLPGLELDYGRSLFNAGEIKSSEEILGRYLNKDPGNPEAIIMLAYMEYWNGRASKAKNAAQQVIAAHPEHQMAIDLLDEIDVATAPYISLASGFGSDDQPLNFREYMFTVGKYHSRYLSPTLKAGYKNFTLPGSIVQSYFVEVGNVMNFGLRGPVITFGAGVFKPDDKMDITEHTLHAGISQKLTKIFALEINTARIPYQFTLASLEEPLMQQVSSVALSLNDPESLLGKAAYERQTFPDGNNIHTSYAYLLKSLINSPAFRLDLGYSFSYAHSDRSSYRADKEITLRPGMNTNTQVSGIYDPYFSPQNQMIHAGLASIKIVPAKFFEIKLRTSYGIYATADNPVLLVSSGQGNSFNLNKFIYQQTYTPVEVFAEGTVKLSRQFSIKADYQYSKLFFYEFHRLGLSANYNFLKRIK